MRVERAAAAISVPERGPGQTSVPSAVAVIVALPSGKTVRTVGLPKSTEVTLHRWVTPTSMLVELKLHQDGWRSARLHEPLTASPGGDGRVLL